MDNSGVSQGIIATAIIIPLITVAHIILAAVGCIAAFFLVKGLAGALGKAGGRVKEKAKSFGREVGAEAERLRAQRP